MGDELRHAMDIRAGSGKNLRFCKAGDFFCICLVDPGLAVHGLGELAGKVMNGVVHT